MRATITLNDGTRFENLEYSGNTFTSGNELKPEMFPASKLHGVIMTFTNTDEDGNTWDSEDIHDHMKLIKAGRKYDGKYMVILADMTAQDMKDLAADSKIEYLALMTGVEL